MREVSDFGGMRFNFFLAVLQMCFVFCLGDSHTQVVTYTALVSKNYCIQRLGRSCHSCGWWGWSTCCNNYYYDECHIVYETGNFQKTICQTGWQSTNCDVPICDPPCLAGKACTSPNTCQCVATVGASCTAVGCSSENNCYPGSCFSSQCRCPMSFSGPNCQTIVQIPEIQKCSVQLIASGTRVSQADCSAPGLTPPTTWISGIGLTSLQASWEAVYTNKISMPDRLAAPNVMNSPVPIGVTDSSLIVAFNQGSTNTIPCTAVSPSSPTDDGKCQISKPWSEFGILLKHNDVFSVTARASLGGQKTGMKDQTSNSDFASQPFTGNPISWSAQFKVDMQPPVHCLANPNNDCPLFPIFLDKDIRTNPQIQPTFQNWTDDGSGIVNFHVEIYFMQPGADNLLANTGAPLQTSDIKPSLNNFIYVCTTSGVYSIELTVFDQANNSAKARKLFIYNKDSKLQTDATKPAFVREADPATGYTWITSLGNIQRSPNGSYVLTLDWTGHFTSTASFSGSWGLGARAWLPNTGIDDLANYRYKYGFRTISALTDLPNGITSYSVGFIVDKTTGGKGASLPSTVGLNSTSTTYSIAVPSMPDGSAIVIWLECNDISGGLASEKLTINVETSPPAIASNYTFTPKSIDEFTSTVFVWAFDKDTGIKSLNFSIYDQTLKQTIHSDNAPVHTRDPPVTNSNNRKRKRQDLEQPCTPDDKTCYCVPQGSCFNYIQRIDIDHCWIDRYAGHPFELRLDATNFAGLSTSLRTIGLGVLTDIPCRPQPTPAPISGGVIAGIIVGVVIGVLVLIFAVIIVIMLIRVYGMRKEVPRGMQSLGRTLRIVRDPVTTDNELYIDSSPKLSAKKDNRYRTPPEKMNPPVRMENQRNDDVYIYSADSEYIANPNQMNGYWIPKEKVEVENELHKGRMMVVSKAYLTDGNQRNAVAVKALKNGFSQKDLKLMTAKTDLMARLRPHINIVKFIGAIQNDNMEGPIIVMELCEITLQQWLKNNSSVTVDVFENMLTFCLNIAHGLQHLHANKIIHTRMAVRNVLLTKQFGGYVAKLIGFGPNRESQDKNNKVSLPIKWLAPETLATIKSTKTTYNEKTDVWSFAITAWEIYSKGDQLPYPNLHGSEAEKAIKAGEKMDCPEDCPTEVFNRIIYPCWDLDPARRPTTRAICGLIEDYRNGSGSEPIGYYETKDGSYSVDSRNNAGYDELYDEAK